MSDPNQPKRSLSEISHLFLSSVRERHTNGAPRPQRIPPKGNNVASGSAKQEFSIDLTPEELAQVTGAGQCPPAHIERPGTIVTALLSAHLNGHQNERVKEYARHLAVTEGPIGLLELDASEFRVMLFDADGEIADADEPQPFEVEDCRELADALAEMSFDVRRWLVVVPSLRTPEARALLRSVENWTLLSTCDHDGVVASYRLLKGLAEGTHPRLALALLDPADETEIERIYKKLAGVCEQFLNWKLQQEPPVRPAPRVSEQMVLCSRPIRDKAQIAAGPHWETVAEFLAGSSRRADQSADIVSTETEQTEVVKETLMEESQLRADAMPKTLNPVEEAADSPVIPTSAHAQVAPLRLADSIAADEAVAEILDLSGIDSASILSAVLKQNSDLIECPVRPPMCGEARLAIARDRSLVLLAVAGKGLSELRAIGQAHRWMLENRTLLGMALPQFAIDAHSQPHIRLLVDQSDIRADVLQPMLQSDHITVQAYRRLRWGAKMGMLLEAA
ncbi:MAG TPA: hypothetical protein VH370_16640 [Humisphaera sp.]|jgi:hypothetical protein|nr:hypothetical protein [Humisphaera sp.]